MEEKNKDNLDRLSIKDGPSTLWSLPDFGDPLTTRNREEFHEPAQNYHYSDTEDKDEHKRRDSYFVPSNSAYFKKIGDKKNPKKKIAKNCSTNLPTIPMHVHVRSFPLVEYERHQKVE